MHKILQNLTAIDKHIAECRHLLDGHEPELLEGARKMLPLWKARRNGILFALRALHLEPVRDEIGYHSLRVSADIEP